MLGNRRYRRITQILFSQTGAIAAAAAVAGLLIAYLLSPQAPPTHAWQPAVATAQAIAATSDEDHTHGTAGMVSLMAKGETATQYACPMACVPPMHSPGRCPICGMELVAVHAGGADAETAVARLSLTPAAIQRAAVQTTPVVRRAVSAEVRLFGRIDYDSAHMTEITAFMPGVIDRVYVKRAGQFVRWGDPLFDISSSDLLETQRQLIAATRHVPSFLAFQAGSAHTAQDVPIRARSRPGDGQKRSPEQEAALKTIAAVRHKLSILGLPKRDIDEMLKKGEATGIATVYAPMYGQVIVQDATEGAFVNTGSPLFTIADPKYVWARLDVYESDYAWVRRGQQVSFGVEAYPGETFTAKVVYIDPVFDAATRTFSIGAITTEDQGGRLKAGMLVRAALHAQLDADGRVLPANHRNRQLPLAIPASAPLITGRRSIVYVAVPDRPGSFEGREVILGPRSEDFYLVREGLQEGEMVVTQGNFKLDSALQIMARPSLLYPQGGAAGHQHGSSAKLGNPPPTARHDANHEDHPASQAASPVATAGPVTAMEGHQNPGPSDTLAADYEDRRRESRVAAMNTHENHEMAAERPGRHQVSGLLRRKPGQYGDSLRQATQRLGQGRRDRQ